MKQETLEESLYKYVKDSSHELYELRKQCFLDGYKLAQERMYSEEDMEKSFQNGLNRSFDSDFDRWFEQFKKK